MKKYILPVMLLVLSLFLFSCSINFGKNGIIPKADSIEITKHPTSGDGVEQTITITNAEIIKHITDNLNSLTLEGMDYIKPNMVIYNLVFYEAETEVKQVNIKSNKYLSFSGDNTPYEIIKGELDVEYLDALFTPKTENNTLQQSVIAAYEKKHDGLTFDGVYIITKFDYNGNEVVPFMIGDVADDIVWEEKVGGITFYYTNSISIEVYFLDEIYSLKEAYENGLLTQDNLIELARIQNHEC